MACVWRAAFSGHCCPPTTRGPGIEPSVSDLPQVSLSTEPSHQPWFQCFLLLCSIVPMQYACLVHPYLTSWSLALSYQFCNQSFDTAVCIRPVYIRQWPVWGWAVHCPTSSESPECVVEGQIHACAVEVSCSFAAVPSAPVAFPMLSGSSELTPVFLCLEKYGFQFVYPARLVL